MLEGGYFLQTTASEVDNTFPWRIFQPRAKKGRAARLPLSAAAARSSKQPLGLGLEGSWWLEAASALPGGIWGEKTLGGGEEPSRPPRWSVSRITDKVCSIPSHSRSGNGCRGLGDEGSGSAASVGCLGSRSPCFPSTGRRHDESAEWKLS